MGQELRHGMHKLESIWGPLNIHRDQGEWLDRLEILITVEVCGHSQDRGHHSTPQEPEPLVNFSAPNNLAVLKPRRDQICYFTRACSGIRSQRRGHHIGNPGSGPIKEINPLALLLAVKKRFVPSAVVRIRIHLPSPRAHQQNRAEKKKGGSRHYSIHPPVASPVTFLTSRQTGSKGFP
jgi:hypothetical protein